jgi:competence protein ComEA
MKLNITLVAMAFGIAAGSAVAGPVNINTADEAALAKELNGVGPAKAEAIVKDRKEKGPFKSAQDLSRVDGIGDALIEQNKDNIKIKD